MKLSTRNLIFIAALAAFALLRLELLPPLVNANAPGELLTRARQQVEQREAELRGALAAAAPLRGRRGDFERRSAALSALPPSQQAAESRSLARDAQRLQQVARTAARYRDALAAYDQALMARTRDLGPRAEQLRAETWPIVEHVKLYPPPRGENVDFRPPDAQQLAEWTQALEAGAQGDLRGATDAAVALGRSTFALYRLVELDQQYRAALDRYAGQLEAQLAIEQPPSALQTLLAGVATAATGLILALALALLAKQTDSQLRPAVRPEALVAVFGAAALYYLVPATSAALLGALLLGLIFLRWPAAVPAAIPASIFFYYRPRRIEDLSFTLVEVMILLAAGAFIASVALGRRRRPALRTWLREPLAWGALVFLLAALLSFASPLLVDQRVALRELRRIVVEPLIFLALLAGADARERGLAIDSFIVAGSFVAGDALVRLLLGHGTWAMEGVPRLIGLLPSSTALGIVLGAATAGALARAWPPGTGTGLAPAQPAYALLALPLTLATALTFTRGAWLGVAAALLAVMALQRAWRRLLLAASALTLGMAALSLLGTERFRTMFSLSEGTGAARIEIWSAALRLLSASPLTGAGLDQFVHQDPQRFAIPHVRLLAIAHPHNVLLDLWIQVGLLGMLTALGLSGLTLWRLARRARGASQAANPAALAPMLATIAILVDLLVHGMVDQALLGADMMVLFWACVAQALPASRPPAAARRSAAQAWRRPDSAQQPRS